MTELKATHELHERRKSRNVGVGLALLAFVVLMFGLSMVKVMNLGATQGFDHVVRPEMLPAETSE